MVADFLRVASVKVRIILLRHGQAVADAIPNSRFVVIHGMGHVFFNHVLAGAASCNAMALWPRIEKYHP